MPFASEQLKTLILSWLPLAIGLAFTTYPALSQSTPSEESVQLRGVPLGQVVVQDQFWSPRVETNRRRSLEHQYQQCVDTGRIANFEVAAGLKDGQFQGRFYNDSDVYKWIEGASYSLTTHPDRELEKKLDEVIAKIAAAQEESGYLNTFFQLVDPSAKWTSLGRLHELYCAGHLIEAAVAHHEATGKRSLLDVAIRFADHIDSIFGAGKRDGTGGHEEIELALIKLFRVTGEEKYLRLAGFFLDQRGQSPSFFQREYERLKVRPSKPFSFKGEILNSRIITEQRFMQDSKFDTRYTQDHLPVREQSTVEGHAVRAMYLFSGMADVAYETGDTGLLAALRRLHHNVTQRRMYVTGGIGPSKNNEGFTGDYDLPNDTAYQETCASVGMIFWNYRMLNMTGDDRYADVMERALYNGMLAGISLSGDRFFYINPLYSSGKEDARVSRGRFSLRRQAWFDTACCPTNLARLFPSLGKYIYSRSEDNLWVNLYIGSRLTTEVAGQTVLLEQQSRYPWDGRMMFRVKGRSQRRFSLNLRIPGWARTWAIRVNEATVSPPMLKGYARLQRAWKDGDTVELTLPMPVERVVAHPLVVQNRGKVVLRRGPLVYCLEQRDHEVDLDEIVLPLSTRLETHFEPGLLGGVSVISGSARTRGQSQGQDQLYRPLSDETPKEIRIKAIPYYAWANRQQGKMTVWVDSSP
ncbi:glycoside hydrolase family 127 protein [Acidobacteria bacterium AH-259-O06]|nr:glycoside hydrolase family 127 protein [Acidobacteria bacterium AH-259-O06]